MIIVRTRARQGLPGPSFCAGRLRSCFSREALRREVKSFVRSSALCKWGLFSPSEGAVGEDVHCDAGSQCQQENAQQEILHQPSCAVPQGDPHERYRDDLGAQRDGALFPELPDVGAQAFVCEQALVEAGRSLDPQGGREQQEGRGGQQREKDPEDAQRERQTAQQDVHAFHVSGSWGRGGFSRVRRTGEFRPGSARRTAGSCRAAVPRSLRGPRRGVSFRRPARGTVRRVRAGRGL